MNKLAGLRQKTASVGRSVGGDSTTLADVVPGTTITLEATMTKTLSRVWAQREAKDNGPPRLVRIDLQLADGRLWTPLIIAPMIEARSSVTK